MRLEHYDFYRLGDEVGVMAIELEESFNDSSVVVVEWGSSVHAVLPEHTVAVKILPGADELRTYIFEFFPEQKYIFEGL